MDRDGSRYRMAFVRGKTVRKLETLGKARGHRHDHPVQARSRDLHRARVPLLHAGRPAPAARVPQQGRDASRSRTSGSSRPRAETFFAKGGLVQFVEWLNRNKKPLHPKPIAFTVVKDDVDVDIALQYEDGYNENTFTFVNNINTHEGGTHLTGFKAALTRTINDVAKRRDFLKKEGLHAVGRGHPRGAYLRAAREGQGAAVRGADQDQARQLRGRGHRQDGDQRAPRQLPRGAPAGRAQHHRKGRERRARPRGRAQGARPHPQEVGPREHGAARQAGRLLDRRSRRHRDLPRRGRFGRRQRQAGARPLVPGHPAAARARS